MEANSTKAKRLPAQTIEDGSLPTQAFDFFAPSERISFPISILAGLPGRIVSLSLVNPPIPPQPRSSIGCRSRPAVERPDAGLHPGGRKRVSEPCTRGTAAGRCCSRVLLEGARLVFQPPHPAPLPSAERGEIRRSRGGRASSRSRLPSPKRKARSETSSGRFAGGLRSGAAGPARGSRARGRARARRAGCVRREP